MERREELDEVCGEEGHVGRHEFLEEGEKGGVVSAEGGLSRWCC